MDAFAVLMNEIQSLKKEIISLREQNLTLYNELARHHAILNNAINATNNQSLVTYLARLAAKQTAEFIVNNMNKVLAFDNRNDYLKYVINHTESVSGGGVFGVRRFSRCEYQSNLVDIA